MTREWDYLALSPEAVAARLAAPVIVLGDGVPACRPHLARLGAGVSEAPPARQLPSPAMVAQLGHAHARRGTRNRRGGGRRPSICGRPRPSSRRGERHDAGAGARPHGAGGPRRGPRHRAPVLQDAVVARRVPLRDHPEPGGPLPGGPRSTGRLVGYLCLWEIGYEIHITNLAVHPDRRRQGLARSLIQSVLEDGRGRGVTLVFLEVRPTNAEALGLYESLGFSVIGRRKGYYFDTGEDALVMETRLAGARSDGGLSGAPRTRPAGTPAPRCQFTGEVHGPMFIGLLALVGMRCRGRPGGGTGSQCRGARPGKVHLRGHRRLRLSHRAQAARQCRRPQVRRALRHRVLDQYHSRIPRRASAPGRTSRSSPPSDWAAAPTASGSCPCIRTPSSTAWRRATSRR